MAEDGEDIRSAAITDTTHAGADLAGALTDIGNLTIAVNSIILALEKAGIIADN